MTLKTAAAFALALAVATGCSKPLSQLQRLELDPAASNLSAVAIKNESVKVALEFRGISGWASPDGTAGLSIPLDKLETGDAARDSNLKSIFFEVGKHAAFGSAAFDLDKVQDLVAGMKDGQSLSTRGEGILSLHGAQLGMGGPLNISRKGNTVTVDLAEGWTILIDRTSLGAQLKRLNKLCPQPHRVGNLVTVHGKLVFKG